MLRTYNRHTEKTPQDTDQLSKGFIDKKASKDENWKFWTQFVMKDFMAFIGLYLAIRSDNWNLRMAALKDMALLFFGLTGLITKR